MKTKVYVVEDMAISRIALIEKLQDANFEVVGSAATAETAWQEMQTLDVDLAILDINLAGENDGVWLAEKIRAHLNSAIVFLTAFGDITTVERVMAVNPNGFLMKPYNKPSLLTTVDIAIKAFNKIVVLKKTNDLFVMVENKSKMVKLFLNEILYIQSDGNYITIYMINEQISIRQKLKAFLQSLPKNDFMVQVHLRFVINKDFLKSINVTTVVVDSVEIPVSKTYKNNLF